LQKGAYFVYIAAILHKYVTTLTQKYRTSLGIALTPLQELGHATAQKTFGSWT